MYHAKLPCTLRLCAYKAKVNLEMLDQVKKYKSQMQGKFTKTTTNAIGSKAFHKSNVKWLKHGKAPEQVIM